MSCSIVLAMGLFLFRVTTASVSDFRRFTTKVIWEREKVFGWFRAACYWRMTDMSWLIFRYSPDCRLRAVGMKNFLCWSRFTIFLLYFRLVLLPHANTVVLIFFFILQSIALFAQFFIMRAKIISCNSCSNKIFVALNKKKLSCSTCLFACYSII